MQTIIDQSIQFVTDSEGNKTAALIPIDIWEKYDAIIQQHLALEASIKTGFEEVRQMREGKMEMKSAQSLLDEL